MKDAFRGTVLIALFVAHPTVATGWHTVQTRCGFTLQVPTGWTSTDHKWDFGIRNQPAVCSVALQPRWWRAHREKSELDVSEFAIYVGISSGTLANACERFIVCKDERGWYFTGRAGARTWADQEKTSNGILIRGVSEVGTYGKYGGYRGTGEAFVAVVERTDHLVEFVADREFQDEEVFRRIVKSLKVRRSAG